jgi:5-methylcytosine-specific restriction endonuclease McrA
VSEERCAAVRDGTAPCAIDHAVRGVACHVCAPKFNQNTVRSRRRRARIGRAQRNAEAARNVAKRRVDLVKRLSPDGACARCKEKFAHEDLTIEHVHGRTWDTWRVSSSVRVATYWREFHADIALEALCISCNASDGAMWARRYARNRGG